jgi:hypothetical protein
MNPEEQSASSRYDAVGDGVNMPEANTEGPFVARTGDTVGVKERGKCAES